MTKDKIEVSAVEHKMTEKITENFFLVKNVVFFGILFNLKQGSKNVVNVCCAVLVSGYAQRISE